MVDVNSSVVEEKEMLKVFSDIIKTKSISPEMGGQGESKRADLLEKMLISWGLKPKRYDYTDQWKTKRSSLVAKFGDKERTIWILSHIDTVAEGDLTLWKTDPFSAVIKDEKIYGRGTNDDGSGLISSLYAAKSLLNDKARLKYNVGLVLAADEENGSKYGVYALVKERIFDKNDLFVVVDHGNPKGSEIEIEEKSILWLKFTVTGKQVHASVPWVGLNAFKEAAKFAIEMDDYLYHKYSKKTKLMPNGSTFEITKHEKNVDSINILPGREVFYLDCRIIPEYDPSQIIKDVKKIATKYKAKIDLEIVNREDAPQPTSKDSEVVKILSKTIKNELKVKPRIVAIGGGTVAKPLRAAGFETAVWRIEDNVSHQANEYVKISALKGMVKVLRNMYI